MSWKCLWQETAHQRLSIQIGAAKGGNAAYGDGAVPHQGTSPLNPSAITLLWDGGHQGNSLIPPGTISCLAATDLFGCLSLDELLIDPLGLLCHLHRGLAFLVVLTGHPKLDVLLTELRAQEAAEAGEPICGGDSLSLSIRGAEPLMSSWRDEAWGNMGLGDANLQGFCRSFSRESRHCRASSGDGLKGVKKAQVVHAHPTTPVWSAGF